LTPKQSPVGAVDLTNAKVGRFTDDPAIWPMIMRLRGFAYDSLENDQVSVRARLGWLNRHPGGYTPQLFDQLAAACRQSGHENAARRVAIAKQMRSRSLFNPLNWLWYVTVGYGYRTWLAGGWLAALVALGTWMFSRAYPAHMTATSTPPPGVPRAGVRAGHRAARPQLRREERVAAHGHLPVLGLGTDWSGLDAQWRSSGSFDRHPQAQLTQPIVECSGFPT
jgi:hypothetical protein